MTDHPSQLPGGGLGFALNQAAHVWRLRLAETLSELSVTADGLAVSASLDETLMVWDLASGRCLQVLHGHMMGVTGVA